MTIGLNDVCQNCGAPKPADRFRACPIITGDEHNVPLGSLL